MERGQGDIGTRPVVKRCAIATPILSTATARSLQTDIQTASLFADTRKMVDIDEAVELLSPILNRYTI